MKIKITVILICISMLQSCKPAVVLDSVAQNDDGILLQESRGKRQYIYLLNDKAYYETLVIDKPSYFTGFDTLIRVNKEGTGVHHYEGKNVYLDITDKTYNLTYIAGSDKGTVLSFRVANEKQAGNWNEYKNQEKIRPYAGAVSDLLGKPYPAESTFRAELDQSWKQLIQSTSKLNQKEFDSALINFKTKYSLR